MAFIIGVNPCDPEMVARVIGQVLEERLGGLPSGATGPRAAVPTQARAAVLVDKERLELRSFPIREITDDEILVRVEGCGICGTDLHEFKKDPFNLIPVVLGHEGTGEIVRLGRNVQRDSSGKIVKVGDKIVTSVLTCGQCEACLYTPGRKNLCDNLGVYGLMKDEPENHLNGWFAEYLIIRKGSTFFTVNDMNLNLRMLIEPAAVVVHALERAKSTGLLNFRSRVLVQGCGPIGLLMLAAVRAFGVQHIVAVDGDDNRLNMAAKLGAEHVINIKHYPSLDELVGAVKKATKDRGAHFAFQCTGSPLAASNVWKFVKRGGGICEVGFFVDNGPAQINPHFDICQKEITLVGSWVYAVEEYPVAYNFLRRAQGIGLPVEELITHRFPLDQISNAFAMNLRQEGLKIVVLAPGM
ncbi:MAG: alcohol dehydrogenase catalytic domain-containing protein [Verrucomicrobiota bacterium]|nr:alcohol dehydrogenase catalytic domain-containing protein [Verrucomicrobiota bacterium]